MTSDRTASNTTTAGGPVIRVRGRILESDYVSAQWLHLRARRGFAAIGILVVVGAVAAGVLGVASWLNGSRSASDAMTMPFVAALMLGYFFVYRPWVYRRTYRKHPALHEPVCVDIGDGGFAYRSEHGAGEIPWSMFIRWREGKRLFSIYGAPNLFHIIPKRLLAGDDVEHLRELLTTKLGKAA